MHVLVLEKYREFKILTLKRGTSNRISTAIH